MLLYSGESDSLKLQGLTPCCARNRHHGDIKSRMVSGRGLQRHCRRLGRGKISMQSSCHVQWGYYSVTIGVVAGHQRANCTLTSGTNLGSTSKKIRVKNFEDGFWMVISATIFGHSIRALMDSIATSVPSLIDFRWDCLKSETTPFWSKERNKNFSPKAKPLKSQLLQRISLSK